MTALPHAFTSQNARDMALRSWERRRQREASAPASEPEPQPTTQPSETLDDYASVQLARVRELLDDNDEQLRTTKDPQDRERLARASQVLSERWRILAGIPLPGSRRPGKERVAKAPMPEPIG